MKNINNAPDGRDEDPDPVGSVIFSPDPDPTCNNGYIKLFSSLTKYKTRILCLIS